MDDESAEVRLATTKEREYQVGWQAYVAGRQRPGTYWAAVGWDEAKYASEALWRPVLWSLPRPCYQGGA